MLTRLKVRNFKKVDMDIELARSVVFIGPNNSGKTAALQALTLWELGLRQRLAKREGEQLGFFPNKG
jgi:predicted ATPase